MLVQVLFLVLGGGYLKKTRIPDSVLLVHSKIATISGDNSALNKNGFMIMLPLIPGIKTLPQEREGPTSDLHMFPPHSVSMLNFPLKWVGA